MSAETRNPDARRPDAGLRWAGRVLFLTTLILVTDLALQPGSASYRDLFGRDKIEHAAAFFTLTGLLRLGWPRLPWPVPALLLLGYGVAIEYVQAMDFVGRTASVWDVVADLFGIALGILFTAYIQTRQPR